MTHKNLGSKAEIQKAEIQKAEIQKAEIQKFEIQKMRSKRLRSKRLRCKRMRSKAPCPLNIHSNKISSLGMTPSLVSFPHQIRAENEQMHHCRERLHVAEEGKELGCLEGLDAEIQGVSSDPFLARQGAGLENLRSSWTGVGCGKTHH